jgi:hypothetical protein
MMVKVDGCDRAIPCMLASQRQGVHGEHSTESTKT